MSKSLIITSIANDQHPILKTFATECKNRNLDFIVIGDTKSPAEFQLEGCDFWSVERQLTLPFELAKITPLCWRIICCDKLKPIPEPLFLVV